MGKSAIKLNDFFFQNKHIHCHITVDPISMTYVRHCPTGLSWHSHLFRYSRSRNKNKNFEVQNRVQSS